jgi:hypothetical protein
LNDRPDPLAVGRIFEQIGSVHYDESSKTIFGTIQASKEASLADIDGFQWQLIANVIVCRVEFALAHMMRSVSDAGARTIIRRATETWERFSRQVCEKLEQPEASFEN